METKKYIFLVAPLLAINLCTEDTNAAENKPTLKNQSKINAEETVELPSMEVVAGPADPTETLSGSGTF